MEQEQMHAKTALMMYLFIVLGAAGGILPLMMQGESILESPHFWTGIGAIALLTAHAVIAATKVWQRSASVESSSCIH